jgi:NADP-dependent aldehyde dehydrogenase
MPHAMKARGQDIVAGLHNSITLHAGQYCTNPGLVFLEESAEAKKFEDALAAQMGTTQQATMLNQGIWNAYNKATSLRGATAGVRTLAEMENTPAEYKSSAILFEVDADTFTSQPGLQEEVFGPSSLIVKCRNREQMLKAVEGLEGNLTATIHMDEGDRPDAKELLARLERKAGRIVINGYPTGVEVCQAIVHGGPWPSTSDARSTSVGGRAIERFARPVCYQNTPQEMLPDELQDENPKGILRVVNGERHREKSVKPKVDA